ncbi:MAG: OB-fold protein [Syntrophothermus sp.]
MKLWLKIILGLFILGIIAAALVWKFYINKPQPDYEELKPDYAMTAAELYKNFINHPGEANKLYLGKIIEVTGQLNKIETTDSLVTAVFVFDKGMFGDAGLRCTMMKKFNDEARKLKTDGNVKLKGYCTGYNEGSDVIMEHCSLNY